MNQFLTFAAHEVDGKKRQNRTTQMVTQMIQQHVRRHENHLPKNHQPSQKPSRRIHTLRMKVIEMQHVIISELSHLDEAKQSAIKKQATMNKRVRKT
jgi:Mg2+ and Co2+ transporter CorA